jgi:hypothetical protein
MKFLPRVRSSRRHWVVKLDASIEDRGRSSRLLAERWRIVVVAEQLPERIRRPLAANDVAKLITLTQAGV